MFIKLVRTDAIDSSKIQIPQGEYIIGRGKLLECDDKRISREHGRLEVTDDSLTIKALHQNPCFYMKKGSAEVQLLRQNNSATLSLGDRFGLLPDTFWYEVLICSQLDTHENCDNEKNTEEYCMEQNNSENETTSVEVNCDTTKIKSSNSNKNEDDLDGPASTSLIENENIKNSEALINITQQSAVSETNRQTEKELNDTEKLITQRTTDELHMQIKEQNEVNIQNEIQEPNLSNIIDNVDETTVKNKSNEDQSELNKVPNVQPHQEQSNDVNELNSVVKRSHSPDKFDVKKVKTEPVDEKKTLNDGAGPSLKQDQGADNDGAPSTANASTNNVNNNPPRERCIYGANCYRKNQQHLAQFSHPRDPDWGPGERGVCPYGASCLKVDPRHWRAHEHPPGVIPRVKPGRQVVEKRGNVFLINAHSVNFYDDHFQVEDSDGDSVDYDYEF